MKGIVLFIAVAALLAACNQPTGGSQEASPPEEVRSLSPNAGDQLGISTLFTDASVPLIEVGDSLSSVGDVDGDADLDLLITGSTGSTYTATLYENQLF